MESAEAYLPDRMNLTALKAAAQTCKGCHLYQNATQTVFGEGLVRSRLMLVGEMPGDKEDEAGKPFVGPAGRLLDEALVEAGIDRDDAYVTNVVKHFKWEPRGKRRLHSTPNRTEIVSCLPWLKSEIEVIEPEVLVCLGATAAKALLGSGFRVTKQHGQFIDSEFAPSLMATMHPSSILRKRSSQDREKAYGILVDDLRHAAERLNGQPS